MKAPKLRRIGDFEFIEISGEPSGPCIVLFHGYGADATDLVPLSQYFKAPKETTWIFPNGTLEVAIGPHYSGRAWFPIDIQALEKAQREGRHREMAEHAPANLQEIEDTFYEMLAALQIPFERVIIGGFSQGAMLATYITLHAEVNPKGLIIMSGNLLDQKNWKEMAKKHAGLHFFQCHGSQDELLSVEGAKNLEKILNEAGLFGELQIFHGGHGIPPEAITGVNNYLEGIFALGN